MTRLRWLLALPAILLATSGPSMAAEVRDKAGMFSAEAVKKAQTELDRIEREYSVPVTIEAIPSLDGEPIKDVTTRHAESVGAKGIYLLIAKSEGKIYGEASRGFQKYLPRSRLQSIDDAFIADFKKGNFDAGLLHGVARIDSSLSEARAEAGGSLRPAPVAAGRRAAQAPVPVGRPRVAATNSWGIGSLMMIVIGILGIFLVIRILGALFSAGRGGYGSQARMGGPGGYGPGGPGYGAPGYGGGGGGGGGGFMSSMFGGIGGALAGNWLYDQFSGRHHGSMDQTSYDPAAGAAPAPEAAPEWGEGGAGGDWGGGDAGAGGDWGGGGGGGGDWGGGGGDDGGSW